jgi:signal transduction histidine kinase
MLPDRSPSRQLLLVQLCWFIRLRWIVALAVVVGAILDWQWWGWFESSPAMALVGLGILAYNALLWWILARRPDERRSRGLLLLMSWVQISLDVACLTVLTLWTGATRSPLTGLFVLHMVFASLLLPRAMAYGGALLAMGMLVAGMAFAGHWPSDTQRWLQGIGWAAALLLTVYVGNNLSRSLRRQWRRLTRQNRRIRAMTRTLRRHQEAMVQQEKMVALGQMAAGVAHEIANPLANLDSVLQLMLRKPERLRVDTVRTLREQVERIGQIVQQMTSFAHPAESAWQMARLNDVVEQALKVLELDPRLRRVSVDYRPSPDVGRVRMLPQAMQQVVINLIMNALDAMAQTPQPRLTVLTRPSEEGCLIEITDNGHGIAPEHMSRVFEPFFTTKPVGKGTGLGLSISYSLIRRHGGEIQVRSTVGKATTFTILLPSPALSDARAVPRMGSAGA